jgi:glyoxylase I family protein
MTQSHAKLTHCAVLLAALALGGSMSHAASPTTPSKPSHAPSTNSAAATVRYQVADIGRSITFYTEHLGFQLGERSGSAFAAVLRRNLRLILSGPGSSGSRPMPGGRRQEPGGWNRIVIYVDDLEAFSGSLRAAGVRFRNEVEVGPGGKQILIEDPDGNPIELHEAPATP